MAVHASGSHLTLSKLYPTEQKKKIPGSHHPRRERPHQYVLLLNSILLALLSSIFGQCYSLDNERRREK